MNAGSAYIFTRTNGVWDSGVKIMPNSVEYNAQFGTGVAIEGDTTTM